MSLHSRVYFKRWLKEVPVTSMHEFQSPTFVPGLAKTALGLIESPTLQLVTLDQQLHHLERGLGRSDEFPVRLDVGFRVARLSEYRYRVDLGFFRISENRPLLLGSVEQSLMDGKQRAIRIPRSFRASLSKLYSRCPKRFGFASL